MPAPTYSTLAADDRFSDFVTADATVQASITARLLFVYTHQLKPRVWKPDAVRQDGALLRVAHEREIKRTGKAGRRPVKSKSAGGWSKAYADVGSTAWFGLSGFGEAYLELEDGRPALPLVSGGSKGTGIDWGR